MDDRQHVSSFVHRLSSTYQHSLVHAPAHKLWYTSGNHTAERRARESTAQAVAEGASRGKPCLVRISQAPGLRPDGTLESRRAVLVRHRRSNPDQSAEGSRQLQNGVCLLLTVTGAALRFADRDQACWPDPARDFDSWLSALSASAARRFQNE